MAVFNGGATIRQAIESALLQTGVELEVIVIDGGSTDGTIDILKEFASRVAALVIEPDEGLYFALNKGLALATGEVIGFLHSDDSFEAPDILATIAQQFFEGDIDAVYGDLMYVSAADNRRPVRYWRAGPFQPRKLALGWMPPHPTLFVHRRIYEQLGGFDVSYRISADYDMILRMFSRPTFRAAYLPQVFVRMRTGGISNRSVRNMLRKSREDYAALRKNGTGTLLTVLWKMFSKLPQFAHARAAKSH